MAKKEMAQKLSFGSCSVGQAFNAFVLISGFTSASTEQMQQTSKQTMQLNFPESLTMYVRIRSPFQIYIVFNAPMQQPNATIFTCQSSTHI